MCVKNSLCWFQTSFADDLFADFLPPWRPSKLLERLQTCLCRLQACLCGLKTSICGLQISFLRTSNLLMDFKTPGWTSSLLCGLYQTIESDKNCHIQLIYKIQSVVMSKTLSFPKIFWKSTRNFLSNAAHGQTTRCKHIAWLIDVDTDLWACLRWLWPPGGC